LPLFLFSLSILHRVAQRCFVAIVECIESLKNDVKQKMVDVSCSFSSTLTQKGRDQSHQRRSAHDKRAECAFDFDPFT
jgi:hypothetical protein